MSASSGRMRLEADLEVGVEERAARCKSSSRKRRSTNLELEGKVLGRKVEVEGEEGEWWW